MNPNILIAAGILLALVVGFVGAKIAARSKTPAAVAKVEAVIEGDAWKVLGKTLTAVADASGKKAAVANASADLADHFANVTKLKAVVAQLPEA